MWNKKMDAVDGHVVPQIGLRQAMSQPDLAKWIATEHEEKQPITLYQEFCWTSLFLPKVITEICCHVRLQFQMDP